MDVGVDTIGVDHRGVETEVTQKRKSKHPRSFPISLGQSPSVIDGRHVSVVSVFPTRSSKTTKRERT